MAAAAAAAAVEKDEDDAGRIVVLVEFGHMCARHGLLQYQRLAIRLRDSCGSRVQVRPVPRPLVNHFRVYVGGWLIFDAACRYPPTADVEKRVHLFARRLPVPEIPYSRGIPFCYDACPHHENMLTGSQLLGWPA